MTDDERIEALVATLEVLDGAYEAAVANEAQGGPRIPAGMTAHVRFTRNSLVADLLTAPGALIGVGDTCVGQFIRN